MSNSSPTDIHISENFDVKLTLYGGRACFAKHEIPSGTKILECPEPLSYTVLYEFRKEVCHQCWKYNYGDTCKIKLDISKYPVKGRKFTGAGLWFCSDECMEAFTKQTASEVLISAYDELQHGFQMVLKRPEVDEVIPDSMSPEIIESCWSKVTEWESQLQKMKRSKWMNQIPTINEDDYITARFLTKALHSLVYGENKKTIEIFGHLQSNEQLKIKKFPVLLSSQVNTYKFMYVLLPPVFKEVLNIELFRRILGAEYGNAFGIWQQTDNPNENKEYLGYGLFPEASYFNHSCSPNLVKIRVDNKMHFVTKCDIQQNEQLCIDYGDVLSIGIEERQKELENNWFFKCGCVRCIEELAHL